MGGMQVRSGWVGLLRWSGVLAIGVVAGVVAGQYVAGRSGEPSPGSTAAPQTYLARDGTLSRTLSFPAVAEWAAGGAVYAPTGGMVTEIGVGSGLFHSGEVVLRLNERPVVLVPGSVPAFRSLAAGARGRDVAALNAFLAGLGYRVDRRSSTFTTTTRSAVKAWQRSLGRPTTGKVALGDVLFVEPLDPGGSPMRWTPSLAIGAQIAPGIPILERLAPTPTLEIEFGASPPDEIAEGSHGVATFPGGRGVEVVLSGFRTVDGQLRGVLTAPSGPLCSGAECLALIPADGTTPVSVEFTLVPSTTGPLLPAAAVQSDAAGQAFVALLDGRRQPVKVVVASNGLVIVQGIESGQEVVLP